MQLYYIMYNMFYVNILYTTNMSYLLYNLYLLYITVINITISSINIISRILYYINTYPRHIITKGKDAFLEHYPTSSY